MPAVPELSPKDVGTPVPVSPHIAPETYTYDYIVVGGEHVSPLSYDHNLTGLPSLQEAQPAASSPHG